MNIETLEKSKTVLLIRSFSPTASVNQLSEALVEVLLPLWFKIGAADRYLYDNEGAVERLEVAGGRAKNASCSELR